MSRATLSSAALDGHKSGHQHLQNPLGQNMAISDCVFRCLTELSGASLPESGVSNNSAYLSRKQGSMALLAQPRVQVRRTGNRAARHLSHEIGCFAPNDAQATADISYCSTGAQHWPRLRWYSQ